MTSEEDFARALRASAELAPAPAGDLLALNAELRGRNRVLRRRAAGASAVALVATAGCALALLPWGTPADVSAAGDTPSAAAPTPPDGFMSHTLRSLLPKEGKVDAQKISSTDRSMTPSASAEYDDGHGPAQVGVTAERVVTPLTDADPALQCPDTLEQPTTTCHVTARPDGSRLVTAAKAPRWNGDTRTWTATFSTPDGRMIRAFEIVTGFADDPDREQPPLPMDGLQKIATSDDWKPAFDQLPPGRVFTEPVTTEQVAAALREALPAGAVFDPGKDTQNVPGRIHGTVTLNGRTSNVVATVAHNWQYGLPGDERVRFQQMGSTANIHQTVNGIDAFLKKIPLAGPGHTPETQGTDWFAAAQFPGRTVVTVKLWTPGTGNQHATGPGALDEDQVVALVAAANWSHA
ncbi:hypothetical protein [Kitasatospora sp. CB01950]|uniref:hypothetical protein n=1 Tax=Kitasatospora sp. CB01950 TaxID=1703930 RepID=UPI00093A74F9|nr:hypothetical protein [Kitasatospora sp. CB01950]OKJ16072.1 hypothetical protein AMK19_07875 [Kitasatospora sp. CB01950]